MLDEKQGICETCGFLGKRPARKYRVQRAPGFFEVEQDERASPGMVFWPGRRDESAGSVSEPVDFEFACRRGAANLIQEIDLRVPLLLLLGNAFEEAARQVLAKPRACKFWGEYQPSLDPQRHLEEMKYLEVDAIREKTKKDSDRAMRRLTWRTALLAVIAALLVGFMQMTSESVIYRAVHRLFYGEAKISAPVVQPPSPINE